MCNADFHFQQVRDTIQHKSHVKLFIELINRHTNKGDLVLDICAGSGTTGIACRKYRSQLYLHRKRKEICGCNA